jgi:hypothetical protein
METVTESGYLTSGGVFAFDFVEHVRNLAVAAGEDGPLEFAGTAFEFFAANADHLFLYGLEDDRQLLLLRFGLFLSGEFEFCLKIELLLFVFGSFLFELGLNFV